MPTYLLRYHGTDLRLPEDRPMVIGRSPECDICVNDPGVSRKHAQLKVEPEGVWVEDLGSQNGVYVNGNRIERATCLKTGDWFRVGRDEFALRIVWERSARPSSPSSPGVEDTHTTTLRTVKPDDTLKVPEESFERTATSYDRQKTAQSTPPPVKRMAATTMAFGADVNPLTSMMQSCRRALSDDGLPIVDRINGAMHLIQALVDMGAEREGCQMLGEMIDAVARVAQPGILPPLTAARIHALLGRWWMQVGAEPEWQQRAEALRRAERL